MLELVPIMGLWLRRYYHNAKVSTRIRPSWLELYTRILQVPYTIQPQTLNGNKFAVVK